MADTHRTSEDEATDFCEELNQEQRRCFKDLAGALAKRDPSLRWYHRVGQLVGTLREESERSGYGAHWMHRLARALGVSHNLLTKPLAFAQRFPAPGDVAELEQLQVKWTAVVTSMSLREREDQLAVLREAAAEKWSPTQLEWAVRERLGTRKQPRAGRTPRPPAAEASEAELADLLNRSRKLARYLAAKWLTGDRALLLRLQRGNRRRMAAPLRDLLAQAVEALSDAASKVDQVRSGLREVAGNGRRSANP